MGMPIGYSMFVTLSYVYRDSKITDLEVLKPVDPKA